MFFFFFFFSSTDLFEIAFAADVVAALVRSEAKDGRAEGLQRRAVHSHFISQG